MFRVLTSKGFFKLKTNVAKIVIYKTNKCAASSSLWSKKGSGATKKTFNTPHPAKDLPENYNPSSVNHDAFDLPECIPAAAFRAFTSRCEILGPGADKCGCKQNV